MTEEIKLGKYIIEKELGRGGFGIVYEAHDKTLDRKVALKVLHPNLVNDTVFLTRFNQEAKFAAKLEHNNIVPIYEYNQSDGRYYIAMGLMEMGSLKEILEKHGPRPSAQVRVILAQIASGMAYAHERGVIHRDLKPGNILIDNQGVVKIADFGFAKAMSTDSSVSLSMTAGVLGTPAYMAPEIWEGKEASAQSDIYSLGCIAYEMLIGKPLFDGESAAQIMTKHVVHGPKGLEDLPTPWRTFIERCLAHDLKDRFSSAKELLNVLKRSTFNPPKEEAKKSAPPKIEKKITTTSTVRQETKKQWTFPPQSSAQVQKQAPAISNPPSPSGPTSQVQSTLPPSQAAMPPQPYQHTQTQGFAYPPAPGQVPNYPANKQNYPKWLIPLLVSLLFLIIFCVTISNCVSRYGNTYDLKPQSIATFSIEDGAIQDSFDTPLN